MSAILDDFVRVRVGRPCPICTKTDWCLVARDGSGAICKRVTSSKPRKDAGYYHRTGESTGERVKIDPKPRPRGLTLVELTRAGRAFAGGMDTVRRSKLAIALGVAPAALARLRAGFDGEAYTFPMEDGNGTLVGFRRRFADGRKLSIRGGHEGLFAPVETFATREVHLCEGPTSAAALLTLGFHAIGRPSCSGGVTPVRTWLAARPGLDVVVWGDRDEPKPLPNGKTFRPGQDGALALAKSIWSHCRSIRVFVPTAAKDARDWLRAGAGPLDVKHAINGTAYFKAPRPAARAAVPRRDGVMAVEPRGLPAAGVVRPAGPHAGLDVGVAAAVARRDAIAAGVATRGAQANQAKGVHRPQR